MPTRYTKEADYYFKDPNTPTVFWKVLESMVNSSSSLGLAVCAKCRIELDDSGSHYHPDCKRSGEQVKNIDQLTVDAAKRFESSKLVDRPVVTASGIESVVTDALDPENQYFLNAKFENDGGKKQIVVLFGPKTKSQGSRDKAQVFIDLRKKEVRHDQTNMDPAEITNKITANFGGRTDVKTFGYDDEDASGSSIPYVYLTLRGHSSDPAYIEFTLHNEEDRPIFVEELIFNGIPEKVEKTVQRRSHIDLHCKQIPSPPLDFKPNSIVISLTDKGRKMRIAQLVKSSERADGRFGIDSLIEKPELDQV